MKIIKDNIKIELVNHCDVKKVKDSYVAYPKNDYAMPGGAVFNLDQLIKFCEITGAKLA